MNQPLRIFIIGLTTLDVFVPDVDLPEADGHTYLKEYALSPGGSGLNLAFSLAQLGAKPTLCGRIGADTAGDFVRNFLGRYDIQLSGVTGNNALATGFSIIKVATDGRIGLLHYEGANNLICPDDVDWLSLEQSHFVHVAGAMSMDSLDGIPLSRLLERCKSIGKTTSLHTSRNTDKKDRLFPVLPYLDYIFMNQKEAQEISGVANVEAASRWFHSRGVGTIAITIGDKGAYVSNQEYSGIVPTARIPVVDTTGCGDAFTAGFIDATWRHEHISSCAAFGNAVAAHCARTLGALPKPFTRAELSKPCQAFDPPKHN